MSKKSVCTAAAALFVLTVLFLPGQLRAQAGGAAQPQNDYLLLSAEKAHDLVLSEAGPGTWRVVTTGSDPYLFTKPLAAALEAGKTVLTFEYFSTGYLDQLQVFFGPPITENNSLSGELGVREGWTPGSLDLTWVLQDWGKQGDFLRLDFGSKPGYQVQIRNIRFREPNPEEQARVANYEKRKRLEAIRKAALKNYLDADYPFELGSVSVTADSVIVEGTAPVEAVFTKGTEPVKRAWPPNGTVSGNGAIPEKGAADAETVFLAEVPMHENIAWDASFEYLFEVPGSNSGKGRRTFGGSAGPYQRREAGAGRRGEPDERTHFRIAVPRYRPSGDHLADRLLSKWVLVKKQGTEVELLSHARYADHIQALYDLPEKHAAGKKGIGGFHAGKYTSDLDSLGITSVTVNMWISKMLRSRPSENTISFDYCGKTYYADRGWVESHDRTLRETAKRNILVSSIVLIDKAVNTPDKAIGAIMEHPDCDPAGIYSMANMTSPEGVEYYAAAMDFLARRYSRPDKQFGRVHHWIVHNEVDAGWVWTNMGEADTLLFMDTYHKSMRLVQQVARQYNAHSKAFISLTHYWNRTQDRHFYLSRDLLEILLEYSSLEGDFDWGIAHHPYPESLFEPKSWEDEKANYTFDTPLITFKNIEVLDAWVKQPFTMYLGKHKRTVFLSEQGPNSRDYSPQNLAEQAASMAYVWKKMEVLDGIDAFQFHNWIDNRGEGGLRIGLRRFPDDEVDPGGKKPVWYIYRDLGTPAETEAIEFAKEIIGIERWEEVRYKGEIGF